MKHTFVAPIENLVMTIRKLEVGNVTFYKTYRSIKNQRLARIIDLERKDTPSKLIFDFYSDIIERLSDRVVATVQIDNPDSKAAEKIAIIEIEHALNILRFYLRRLTTLDPYSYLMLIGMVGTISTNTTMLARIGEDGKFSMSSTRMGYLYNYNLNKESCAIMKKYNFNDLHKVFLKPEGKRSPFEKSILTAIDFFGMAMNEQMFRNAFVSFVIALESLLLRREAKAAVLAERIALILGENASRRLSLFRRTHELYEVRSDIVHEGKDNVTQDHLYNISGLAFDTIAKLIPFATKFNDKKELQNYLNQLKYNGPRFGRAALRKKVGS
jgi:hypothetical protein